MIANSPNRDQLKAQLKPPPSILSKCEKSISNNKLSTRNTYSNKVQKTCHYNQCGNIQSKSQNITVKHAFSTTHQSCLEEVCVNHFIFLILMFIYLNNIRIT